MLIDKISNNSKSIYKIISKNKIANKINDNKDLTDFNIIINK